MNSINKTITNLILIGWAFVTEVGQQSDKVSLEPEDRVGGHVAIGVSDVVKLRSDPKHPLRILSSALVNL